jgi:histone deacetylase 11
VENTELFIIDFYNPYIYPADRFAKEAINYPVHIVPETTDSEYLQKLEEALTICIPDFRPDLIIYNAGTDCMIGDPLGNLSISPQGIISRDECIFKHAMNNRIPVVMMLSGGYQYSNAPVIADSIENLFRKFNL